MPLLTLDRISLSYGPQSLLDRVDFAIEDRERVCLIGRNGAGKSRLLRIVQGEIEPDEGQVRRGSGLVSGYLPQELPEPSSAPVYDVVAGGLGVRGERLGAYHRAALAVAEDPSPRALEQLERLQHELEADDGWRLEQRVETVLSRLGLEADRPFAALSGGWRRRVLLARALVAEPRLLILDEPTNHLDIEAIEWLEQTLAARAGALLFVSHDRALIARLATRIVELDRGRLVSWPGDYADYLRRKGEALAAEARRQQEFDKRLAGEEAWIRQGIKARRTRNEGRVRALEALREERRRRRETQGKVDMKLDRGEQSGRIVIEAEGVSYHWQETPVVRGLSTRILRGDRVGLIGPNGCGKTTLLRLLLGELPPDAGRVRIGTRLRTAYFDQTRAQLDLDASVQDNVADGNDRVEVNGKSKHVIGYLQDFLFTPERARAPVRILSGGERNRLLLARLFARPANLLVMDEPTNDLDVETLELLEELLARYDGTLLLVSHDRAFLDNVVTSTLVFEGDGRVREYVGGYRDWLRQRPAAEPLPPKSETAPKPAPKTRGDQDPRAVRRLSYKEKRELEALPDRIEVLEEEQARLQARVSEADFYRREGDEFHRIMTRLEQLEQELGQGYARWEALDGMREGEGPTSG